MRIVSLLPSATEVVCELGLREELVGITHECDFPLGIDKEKRVLIESCLGPEGKQLPPAEIDRKIRETVAGGEGVYHFKKGALEEARPDLVLTQGLCDVCAVPASMVNEAVKALGNEPSVLSLDPICLADIFEDVLRVGKVTEKPQAAEAVVMGLRKRMEAVVRKTADLVAADRPGVVCIEWFDPIFTAGHWVPEMVEQAGGRDVLAKPKVPSQTAEWDAVLAAKPDVMVVMPCGYDLGKLKTEMHLLRNRPGWKDLPAVRNNRVFGVNATAYFSRPGPRTVTGLEQLAQILHPELFPVEQKEWEVL